MLTVTDSHFEFGVEYPELLKSDSTEVRAEKARVAVVKYYSPRVPVETVPVRHYPPGCIPQSKWKLMTGAPENLPGM